jgi:glutathione S-transferase
MARWFSNHNYKLIISERNYPSIQYSGSHAQAKINEFNLYLCSTVHVAHAHKMRGYRWVDDKSAQKALTANVPKTMTQCADMIETHLLGTPWVHGERFTISDPYLYRVSTWLEPDGVDVDNYPKIRAHRAAMEARDSVKTVMAFFDQ